MATDDLLFCPVLPRRAEVLALASRSFIMVMSATKNTGTSSWLRPFKRLLMLEHFKERGCQVRRSLASSVARKVTMPLPAQILAVLPECALNVTRRGTGHQTSPRAQLPQSHSTSWHLPWTYWTWKPRTDEAQALL